MDLGLDGARALIGGGSSGLGHAIGAALAGEGARVALIGRPSDKLDAAASAIDSLRRRRPVHRLMARASAVDRAVEAFGGLDVLLVNSGGPRPGTFDELDDARWQEAIESTLYSAIRLIRSALPHLRASDRPAILVILSSSAREPIPGLTASNTLRPGLMGLIKSLTARSPRCGSTGWRRVASRPHGSPRSRRCPPP